MKEVGTLEGVNISNHKDAARVLRNMVIGIDGIPQVKPGTRITYHEGGYNDNVGFTKVGFVARELSNLGLVHLCQKIIEKKDGDIRKFAYMVEVK